jgi:hypothetical protein
MSDTPRTDKAKFFFTEFGWKVSAELAESLERELNEAKKEIERLQEEHKDFRQVIAEALENAFVEGWERCDLSGEITTKYQWMSSAAKKLADNLMKGI